MMFSCIKQHLATFEAQFMKKLSNTEAELKKSVAYEKSMYSCCIKFWTEFPMLDETQYYRSHTFIKNVPSNILKFKILKVHPFNNSKWWT